MIAKCFNCQKEFITKKSLIASGRGKHCSRKCSSVTKSKYVPWNKGIKGVIKPNKGSFKKNENTGSNNIMWKNDDVKYHALHDWVYRWKGRPSICELCGGDFKIEWANKSHKYKRDLVDWLPLCYWCHRKYDGISPLSKNDVVLIRELYAKGVRQVELARSFGVRDTTIYKIVHRWTWRII